MAAAVGVTTSTIITVLLLRARAILLPTKELGRNPQGWRGVLAAVLAVSVTMGLVGLGHLLLNQISLQQPGARLKTETTTDHHSSAHPGIQTTRLAAAKTARQ
jgi:hypothetical protein